VSPRGQLLLNDIFAKLNSPKKVQSDNNWEEDLKLSKQASDKMIDDELVIEDVPDPIEEEPMLFDEPSVDQLMHPGQPQMPSFTVSSDQSSFT
jgi:hypothetical protein